MNLINVIPNFLKKNLNHLNKIEFPFLRNSLYLNLSIGNIVQVIYKISDIQKLVKTQNIVKERIKSCEGIIIAIKNKGLGKSFTLFYYINGIGIEQLFLYNSPKLISIEKKHNFKVCKSKLYFIKKKKKESII